MRFAPEYVACVLNENFEDAKALLLAPMMAINYAHLVMLDVQGIVPREAARSRRTPPRHDPRRPHAHAARAADDRRPLLPRDDRAARARRRAVEGRLRSHEPQPARRLRDHRHRLSDRPPAHLRAPRL